MIIIAIQPFEVMTQLYANHSLLPMHRIIAPGTMIDSAHFRFQNEIIHWLFDKIRFDNRLLISEKLEISPASITGIMIGGHGNNNLPLWTSITVGGIHLLSENSSIGNLDDKENWHQLYTKVNQREKEIINIKGK